MGVPRHNRSTSHNACGSRRILAEIDCRTQHPRHSRRQTECSCCRDHGDVRSIFGQIWKGHEEMFIGLKAICDDCRANRWDHSINAKYYGARTERLDLSELAALAAAITGVFESTASSATLLKSKVLHGEAGNDPIIREMVVPEGIMVKTLARELETGTTPFLAIKDE